MSITVFYSRQEGKAVSFLHTTVDRNDCTELVSSNIAITYLPKIDHQPRCLCKSPSMELSSQPECMHYISNRTCSIDDGGPIICSWHPLLCLQLMYEIFRCVSENDLSRLDDFVHVISDIGTRPEIGNGKRTAQAIRWTNSVHRAQPSCAH